MVYKRARPSLLEAMAELFAARSDKVFAVREFENAIRDKALNFYDVNGKPLEGYLAIQWKLDHLIEGLKTSRVPHVLEGDFDSVMLDFVFVSRDQFEKVFDLPPSEPQEPKRAPHRVIRIELEAVYSAARAQNMKPPNAREAAGMVQQRLRSRGYTASKHQIKKLAYSAPFSRYRWAPGRPKMAKAK